MCAKYVLNFCFHSSTNSETFRKEKLAIFLILPEEDNKKFGEGEGRISVNKI